MKRWKGLALGTLALLLMSAQPTQAAEEAAPATRMTMADLKAARAEARAQAQADRAAAKQARQQERAATIEGRKTTKEAQQQERAAALEERRAAKEARQQERAAALEERRAAKEAQRQERAAALEERKAAKEAQRQERAAALEERKAAREAQKKERAAVKADMAATRAAEKQELRGARVAAKQEKRTEKVRERRERDSRYKTLFTDNNFTYYLDEKNTRWIPRPYQSSAYIIDTWVRLVENTTGEQVAEDGKIRPAKYFIEHYYISPAKHEIMFISELEVTGRPENAVKERAYDPKNWEQLVPGSIEDEIYEAVTARMKSAPGQRGGLLSGTSGMSLRDMVEEYARISF